MSLLPLLAGALAALIAAAPAAAQQQPIVVLVSYPPDRTVVEKADLLIEGVARSPGATEVEIRVNEERPVVADIKETLFREEVSLEEGENVLRIGEETRRVWLAAEGAPAPAGWQRVYGHVGLDDGCLECHEFAPDGSLVLAGEPEEICGWCHGDLVRGRGTQGWASVHAPVRDGKCLACHAAHTSTQPGLPAAKPPACADCHAAVYERMKSDRFVHGPMNLGDCRLCHAVHASAAPRLLVRPAASLCVDCHSEVLPPAGAPPELAAHPMIPEGQCFRCHDAHSSPNQLLLKAPAARLCLECHEGKTRSFHEAKGFSIYVCAKCHDLHRPTQPHLIVDASRSLCLECHDFRGEAAFRHSFVAEGKCFLCHSFHEAPLSGDVASVCLPCHRENPRLAGAHRGIDVRRARCTACHLPHQSKLPKLLRAAEHTPFARRDCDACHRERAAKVGGAYRPLCTDCHTALATAAAAPPPATVHPPFRDADCASCHRSHNAEAAGLLVQPQSKLCLDCHRKMRKSMLIAPVSAHDAVLEGRCSDCHEPHLSTNESLLRRGGGELCAGCHAALVRGAGGGPWAFGHKPVEEGKCRVCHRHHTSTSPALLKTGMPQPCRPCHGPFFKQFEADRGRHAPVEEGRCGACHRTHGGELPRLLAAPGGEGCRTCHPDLKSAHHRFGAADLEARQAGATARGCLLCHRPHSSPNRRLLVPQTSEVCTGCHKT